MNTMKIITVLSLTIVSIILGSCSETLFDTEETRVESDSEKSAEEDASLCEGCTFSGTPTESEIKGLIAMREEEKLARDVYRKFYTLYNVPIFNNISKSEDAHTSAVLYLLNGYGIDDPALAEEGEFTNEIFTGLYSSLVEKGSKGLIEALKVGAYVEELDIADLMKLLEETHNEDVKRVYGNLLRGSEFHLQAYTNMLKLKGETYEPTVISMEEYKEIISVEDE